MIHKRIVYRRHQRRRNIARKKSMSRQYYGLDYYRNDGQYDKGKIHCSCWMCSGKRKHHGLSMSDRRKMLVGIDMDGE